MINETTEALELACSSAMLELSLLLACTAELSFLEQVVSTKQDKEQRSGSVPTKRKSSVKFSHSHIEFLRTPCNES